MLFSATFTKSLSIFLIAMLAAITCTLTSCSSTKIITEYDCADAANINKINARTCVINGYNNGHCNTTES